MILQHGRRGLVGWFLGAVIVPGGMTFGLVRVRRYRLVLPMPIYSGNDLLAATTNTTMFLNLKSILLLRSLF